MSTVYALITVAAVAVLVAVLFLPVLQIYGTSMSPTLKEGEYRSLRQRRRIQNGGSVRVLL